MQTDPFGGGGPAPSISLPGLGGPGGPGDGGGDPGASGSKSFEDNIKDALDSLRAALSAPDADHEEKLMASKAETQVQQILSMGQKLVDQATGGGPAVKLVRKQNLKSQSGGSPAGGGGGGYGG